MAIQQNNKIIASEINNSAATNFSQGAFIYASDIASLYGGTDNIAKGVLIKAEHFQNLGLPGSGGLNGTFNGVSFKNAIADSNSGLQYIQDGSGWTLYITKGGTINFTNFGRYGSSTDIFMIGGGGAGNKDGLSGSGGFYSTTNSKVLSNNTSYSISIGTGGTTNGATGGITSGFGISVNGGYGGKAHIVNGYNRGYTITSWKTYGYDTSGSIEIDGESYRKVVNKEQMTQGDTIYLVCDGSGNTETATLYEEGQLIYGVHRGADGWDWYRLGDGNWANVNADITSATRPSDEFAITTIFGITNAGGPGPASSVANGSYYGQGGGSLGQYGGSSFGKGANGIIAIRNHR